MTCLWPAKRVPSVLATFAAISTVASPLLPIARGQEFTSPPLDALTSWIGNSYGGGEKWVQQDIHAMAVLPDGTVYTNVGWDEAGGNAGEYRDGALIRYARHTHGWGNTGGDAVAANAQFVYLDMAVGNESGHLKDPSTWPPKGSTWLGISRRQRADLSQGAPFEGGKGGKGDSLVGCFLVVAEVSDHSKAALPGICANEHQLYVADPTSSQVKVFDAGTMQPIASWEIDRTGPMALDAVGRVWMLQTKSDTTPARLVCFDPRGAERPLVFPFAPKMEPVAFCFASNGHLLVADDGPTQQVRNFSVRGTALVESGAFGEPGGIASGKPGAFGDRKLNHVTALGCDAKDNLYLAQDAQSGGGGTVLESYRLTDGVLNWRLFGLTFVDMADLDPGSDTDVFTKEEHFHLDYTQPAGREWSYAGYTIGRFRYPEDPRLHLWSAGAWVRRIGGQPVLFVNDMNAERLQVYRFAPGTDGEVAIPSGLLAKSHLKETDAWPPHQPKRGEWIWRDANGNGAFDANEYATNSGGADAPAAQGWWVDQQGGVWLATETKGVRYLPCQGVDLHGNPEWEFASMQTFLHPDGFHEVKRLRYDSTADTLYLGGTTTEDRNQHWKPMGPVLARYDGWLHGARTLRWRVTLPYATGASGHESCEPMGFDVAGDFVFVPYTGASKDKGVKTGRVEIFRASDGNAVGHIEPGAAVGEIGLQDIRECLTAHHRADGEYIVLLEDDYRSKVVMYRLKGLK